MADRLSAQSFNREAVPKQPNRYLPHIGAKEMARLVWSGQFKLQCAESHNWPGDGFTPREPWRFSWG